MPQPSRTTKTRALVPVLLFMMASAAVSAQTSSVEVPMPPLGATFTFSAFGDLPTGSSIYSLLDAAVPEVITDRIDAGGLTAGQAARLGARGSSWTQTTFRLGDADITDANRSGAPLLMPGVLTWERMDVTTGLLPIDLNAPGMAVTLVPRRPSASWTRTAEFFGGPASFVAGTTISPPAIARPDSWRSASLFLSGPVTNRLSILAAGTWVDSSFFERADPTSLTSSNGSAFTHLVFTPNTRDEVRVIGWAQRTTNPYLNRIALAQPLATEEDTSAHGQFVWERRASARLSWAVFGSMSWRDRSNDLQPSSSPLIVERLNDGPIPQLLNPGMGTDTTWSVGARLKRAPTRLRGGLHSVSAGLVASGGSASTRATFTGRIGETVNGIPARIWDYTRPIAVSERSDSVITLYGDDTMRLTERFSANVGIRFESVNGSAAGAATGVSWNNFFPRAAMRFRMFGPVAAVAGYGRYGYQLSLQDLTYGDPAAPVANVFRWDAVGADPHVVDQGPLVARMGPGTGGTPSFSAIDPELQRPHMDEFVFGFQASPRAGALYRLLAIARREQHVLGAVDVGVPPSTYTTVSIEDPIADKNSPGTISVANRSPSTFGADRYLLTNPADNEATFVGVEISAEGTYKRFFYLAGVTAGRSEGLSADIGFTPTENDQGVLGSLYIDPNARTRAQGRLFTERGYTIKTAGVYQFPADVRLGVSARYEDGEHFARLLAVPGLNQGAELVRAFRNGLTRFTFIMTIDARLQKAVTIGTTRLDFIADAYNLLNTGNEIEEVTVSGPDSRLTSAVQAPRSFRLGVRVTF